MTRLAPSPTGALHLGNARTFLINWAMARQAGWRIILRIEDLDGPRIKAGAAGEAIDLLRWLGLDWDEGPYDQTSDLTPYRAALESLSRKRLLYPCACTRKEIEQAQSAPHEEDGETRYPGTCRPVPDKMVVAPPDLETSGSPTSWRVIVPDETVTFHDRFHCEQAVNVQRQIGDFIVATKAGLPAYQLAVVVDDARQGVTQVVRGDDLLSSTARQIGLYRMLALGPPPHYTHLPLVVGVDGRRLAKRHGDTRLTTYRDRGVSPQRIIGLLAAWSGVMSTPAPCTAAQFAERFRLANLSRQQVTFTHEDEAWLTA